MNIPAQQNYNQNLERDLELLRQLQDLGLRNFSHFNNIQLPNIKHTTNFIDLQKRISDIFREIHTHARNKAVNEKYFDICQENTIKSLDRYTKLNEAIEENNENKDYATTVLADNLRGKIPTIPDNLEEIRDWFKKSDNQETLLGIIHLDMPDSSLECIPKELFLLRNLKNLNLSGNDLSTVPHEIYLLQKLEKLNLERNDLKTLPETLCNLENLKELCLNNNLLINLPVNLGNLNNLRKLHLQGNCIGSLPDSICRLLSLEVLNLFRNDLTTLPENFGALLTLRKLILSKNNLPNLPVTFINLVNLIKLYLDEEKLINPPFEVTEFLDSRKIDTGTQKKPRI